MATSPALTYSKAYDRMLDPTDGPLTRYVIIRRGTELAAKHPEQEDVAADAMFQALKDCGYMKDDQDGDGVI